MDWYKQLQENISDIDCEDCEYADECECLDCGSCECRKRTDEINAYESAMEERYESQGW